MTTKKPQKILLLADEPGWAWDRKSRVIKKYLSEYYHFDIAYSTLNRSFNLNNYDAVLVYWWRQPYLMKGKFDPFAGKIFLGVSSCFEAQGQGEQEILKMSKKDNVSVFVHNKILLQQFEGKVQNLFFCPNGVETSEFKPKKRIQEETEPLTVGFVGAAYSGAKKGIYDFILPALEGLDGVEIKYLEPQKGKKISLDAMCDFYNEIDCIICASETEGTPNPCLEAAACGRPIITTRVGNMPELIIDSENSLFVERDIEDIRKKITFYRDNRSTLIEHGKKIHEEVMKNWNWERQVMNYKKMFDSALTSID